MILQNSDGEEVLRALANGDCVTEVIEAGDYAMVLTHGGHVEEIEPVFLIPTLGEEQVTKRDEFDQKEVNTANGFSSTMHRHIPGGLVKFFENIRHIFTHPARAQTDTGTNFTTLINTNACVNCNLMAVGLHEADLTEANLNGSNLTGANLTRANLQNARLDAANMTGVTLGDTIFTSAFWCTLPSSTFCGANSIDTCVGGESIEQCTGVAGCEANCEAARPDDSFLKCDNPDDFPEQAQCPDTLTSCYASFGGDITLVACVLDECDTPPIVPNAIACTE